MSVIFTSDIFQRPSYPRGHSTPHAPMVRNSDVLTVVVLSLGPDVTARLSWQFFIVVDFLSFAAPTGHQQVSAVIGPPSSTARINANVTANGRPPNADPAVMIRS